MTTKAVSESIENTKTAYTFEDKGIEGIVADLRAVIDQIGRNLTNARNLISELASRFDESRVYEKGQICLRIKEILRDKIEEHKITERWIERCLPAKYKGKYAKSELSSLSKRMKGNPTATIAKKSIKQDKLEALSFENSELKEALKRQTTLLSADQVTANEIMFIVPKEKFNQLKEAMEISRDSINLVFDKSGVLERAEPDIF